MEGVDLYITAPGTDIADVFAFFIGITRFSATVYAQVVAASFEVRITPTGDKTVIGGPLSLDFTTDGIAELALLDTADPNVFSLVEWTN